MGLFTAIIFNLAITGNSRPSYNNVRSCEGSGGVDFIIRLTVSHNWRLSEQRSDYLSARDLLDVIICNGDKLSRTGRAGF